jgi:hypothetical protein
MPVHPGNHVCYSVIYNDSFGILLGQSDTLFTAPEMMGA